MAILITHPDPLRAVGGVRPPDSRIAREAVELARDVSSPVLFNHVMRCYLLGELLAQAQLPAYDREIVLLSLVLHDLGLTDHARGPRRFEIEGADAARDFVAARGLSPEKSWLVWDNIALHPLDLNLYKEPEAKAVEWGIWADVVGADLDRLEASAVREIVTAYPRLNFKRELFQLLRQEAVAKPHAHLFHPTTMIAHHCLGGLDIPDAQALIDSAPFDE
jgi:hypothetical protein